MEKPGWKDDQGRTLDELRDWSKVDPPAKGFGNLGKVFNNKMGKALYEQ